MNTFADDLLKAAGDEPIEAVVIGGFGWGSFDDDAPFGIVEVDAERKAPVRKGVVLTWAEAEPMLEYARTQLAGAPLNDAIWAWTPTRVLFVSQNDGDTSIESVPRNPADGKPTMPGG